MSGLGFGLYLLFMCSWFLHLPTRYPALGNIRADLLLVCVILVITMMTQPDVEEDPTDRRTRKLLWMLVGYAAITMPLVEWPGSALKIGFPQFFKAFVFFYFTAGLVTTPRRLKILLVVFIACQTLRVLEPLYLHATQGYWGSRASMADWDSMDRLSGAPDDVVNPNGLAAIVLTVIPFLHYLTEGSITGRLIYGGLLPLLVSALVLTASRSGMIGLAGIVILVWLKSRHKLALVVVVALGVAFTIPRLSPDLADRYLSIFSNKTKNAATVEGRRDGLEKDLQVVLHRPIFGYGLGTSEEANWNFAANDLPSHNLYLEITEELGVIGLIIFLRFVGSVLSGLRHAGTALREATGPAPLLRRLVPALQVFIGMNLLFSFASYGLSSYDWYLAAGLTEVVRRLLQPAHAPGVNAIQHVSAGSGSLRPLPSGA